MPKAKKSLGMKPKVQSLDEINQEYANLAGQAGVKFMMIKNTERLIDEHQALIEKAAGELDADVIRMNDLRRIANEMQMAQAKPDQSPAEASS